MFLETIKSLPSTQPEQRWIPVSDGLPKEHDFYQVTIKNNDYFNEYYVEQLFYRGTWKWISLDAEEMELPSNFEVLAWQPLPELYKGEE